MAKSSSDGNPTSRDQEFLTAYLSYAKDGDGAAFRRLESLAQKGATTSAFPDDELSSGNFALVVDQFLSDEIQPNDIKEFIRAAEIVVKAGKAFVTNRAYVGNGGATAGSLILEYFAQGGLSASTPKPQGPEKLNAVFDLLEIMTAHGYDLRRDFWDEHFGFAVLLRDTEESRATAVVEKQRAVVDLALKQGLPRFDVETTAEGVGRALSTLKAVLRCGRHDILHDFLAPLRGNAALHAWLGAQTLAADLSENVLNLFLRSPNDRKLLKKLVESYPFIRNWSLTPSVLFLLVEKKEKDILQRLLQLDAKKMTAARNEEGDSLLHHLCRVKGLTAGIAQSFLAGGFDKYAVNRFGETPLAVALKANNSALVVALSADAP